MKITLTNCSGQFTNFAICAGRGTRDAGRGTQDAGRRTRDAGRGTQDAGRRTRDAGRRTQDAGRRTQDAGRKLPASKNPMVIKIILKNICLKMMVGFIYLSFFLVQFNVHLNGTPKNVSYFSCDYSSINNTQHSPDLHLIHSNSRNTHLKLNKRFHPKNLFTISLLEIPLVKLSYQIQSPMVHAEDPLTNYSFNSPSLRGPPDTV
jgi:hypothetical protein